MEEKKRMQITFWVDQDFHKRIKVKAALQNISMTLLIIRAVYKALRDERE